MATPGNEPGSVPSNNKAISSLGDGLDMGRNSPKVSALISTYDHEILADKYPGNKTFNIDLPKVRK